MNLIKKYGNEVIDALFINSMGSNRVYKYFLKALTDGDFEKFANYVRVTARNFEITYKEKYYILRNKFILALEDVVCKTHEDFTDKIYAEEERKYIDDYLFRKEMQKQIVQIRIKKDAKDILKEIKEIKHAFEKNV